MVPVPSGNYRDAASRTGHQRIGSEERGSNCACSDLRPRWTGGWAMAYVGEDKRMTGLRQRR